MGNPRSASHIAVIGMAARFPGADDVQQYWQNLLAGVESIERPSGRTDERALSGQFVPAVAKLHGIEMFDAEYFRVPPAEAVIMDPQHRVLLEVAVTALEDAGYHSKHAEVVGVFAGCGENFYLRDFIAPNEEWDPVGTDQKILSANAKDFLAARLSFKLGLTGPSVTVQTACSTGLSAVALACSALAAGDCDIALAGGVSLLMPDVDGYTFTNGGILSADGHCRTFDSEASGTVPGSGVAMVVLRRDEDALASRDQRRAVIRGWAINNDGGTGAGFSAPSPSGQEAVIQAALSRAGLSSDRIDYVEAHGTATLIGDPVEFEALRRVFATTGREANSCVLGAVKPNIGHTDAAAGVAGLIKAVLAVESGEIPGTLHYRSPNVGIDLDSTPFRINPQTAPWPSSPVPRAAGVSSFGLGGNNAHVVVEQAAAIPASVAVRPVQVVTLSARTEGELQELRTRLAHWARAQSSLSKADLADAAFTLAVGRPQFEYRWAGCTTDAEDMVRQLCYPSEPFNPTRRWSAGIVGSPDEVAEMGKRQWLDEPLFRAAFERLEQSDDPGSMRPIHLAALSGLATLSVLEHLGLSFGRIDAPAWASPVLDWRQAGADLDTLGDALRACVDHGDLAVTSEGAGRLLIGKDFAVPAVVTYAWLRGARIEWSRYYGVERRGRVGLPTYPFARRRFWLSRPDRSHTSAPVADRTRIDSLNGATDVLAIVKSVWGGVLGIDEVDPHAHFVDDLAGDSVYAVDIGAELSETFHVELPVDLPFIAPTAVEAAQYIEAVLRDNLSGEARPASSASR